MTRMTALCAGAFVVLVLLRVWLTLRGRRVVRVGELDDGTEILVRRSGDLRELVLARGNAELVQSRSDGSGYQREFHRAMRVTPRPKRILFLGGGACVCPMQFERRYADVTIDVVEKEALVIEAARAHFGFRESARLAVFVADARAFLGGVAPGSYDLVVLDVYDAAGIPDALVTPEFFAAVHGVLAPGGRLAANLIRPASGAILEAMRTAFTMVEVADVTEENALAIAHDGAQGSSAMGELSSS